LEVPGGAGYLRPGDALALFLERGHGRMQSAKLPRDLEGSEWSQGREVRLKIGSHSEDRVPPGWLVGESLAVGLQALFRQAVSDLGDLALADVGLEGKTAACLRYGLQHIHRACPQALRFALPLGTGLLRAALPLAFGLDPARLLFQQAITLRGDLRRPGRAATLNLDQAAIMQGTCRNTVGGPS